MALQVELRTARMDDLDAIAQVWHESAATADGASPGGALPLTEFRTRIDFELANAWTLAVALVGGRIVGMLALKEAEGVLDQLFVLPASQRHGVGSLLLKQATMSMPSGFTLRTASANTAARRFYESKGLTLASEGQHPRHGYPVCFYEWKGR